MLREQALKVDRICETEAPELPLTTKENKHFRTAKSCKLCKPDSVSLIKRHITATTWLESTMHRFVTAAAFN
jgi:hypothetical protein